VIAEDGVARAEPAGRGSHLHCRGLSHTDEAAIRRDDRFDLGAVHGAPSQWRRLDGGAR
jgi:hypothetical protein